MSLATRISDLATRIATEIKTIRTLVNGNATDLTGLSTTAKGNLVAAINEVVSAASAAQTTANGRAVIDDSAPASSKTYSSTKVTQLIAQAKSDLVNGAGSALDTLQELANALGNDANYAQTVSTALGNRLRFDAAQTLSAAQQTQGQSNLAVYSQTQIGDPDTNFVTVFTNGLA